jgi:two-component system, OmpR family, response regulator
MMSNGLIGLREQSRSRKEPMSYTQNILVIDDDPHLREIVEFALAKAGFKVRCAADGQAGLAAFAEQRPDLVVLDILMPEMDGTEVIKRLRETSQVPVIFLTSVDEEVDRILGLEMGADDYITKPFSPRELVARVKAVLRRVAKPAPEPVAAAVVHGPLRLDTERFKAFWNEMEVLLTVTEFRILLALLSYPGKVYCRDELMDRAYPDGAVVSDRTIDSHIKRIRKKFEPAGGNPIDTVHGMGYRIAEAGEEQEKK